jgi:WhiB family redox-sensing transcriptional regulator
VSRYDWMDSAACASSEPGLWHQDGSANYSKAARICRSCPVQRQCADFAAEVEGDGSKRGRHGLWAGESPRERLARSSHQTRETAHEAILRLTARGGLDPYRIAELVGVDVRTVWRVTKPYRDQMGEAA